MADDGHDLACLKRAGGKAVQGGVVDHGHHRGLPAHHEDRVIGGKVQVRDGGRALQQRGMGG